MTEQTPYTTSRAFLEALAEGGVRYVFANLGSDHPGLVEAYARARANGTEHTLPQLVVCPHESVAMAAAQGYAQVTGVPQAVVVHVECGTQNIGGMLHNAAKGRFGVLLYAGASPYTQEGELFGSRNEFIQWIQDVRDQRGIVRGYAKYDNEIRTGANVAQLVHRALHMAASDPAGPVYLVGPREVMEAEVPGEPAPAGPRCRGNRAAAPAERVPRPGCRRNRRAHCAARLAGLRRPTPAAHGCGTRRRSGDRYGPSWRPARGRAPRDPGTPLPLAPLRSCLQVNADFTPVIPRNGDTRAVTA
ncbi:thiamine pyrophosphate-binding protein [Saccharomonospora saliphila]|uniref:thiamine pyrophosphate-binding protein n=1 Tax=Saccharomonospora saliphila TaxID=369829 RepID=UPI001E5F1F6F|nr:thiamine pyrophosphate-binding protein [Saccharomonospora saliphila]